MFDQLGDMSSTGTLQASSAQRIPCRAAALLEKMGCCSRGPWSAFPWSWRPPRSSTGKTKVVGLVELSMPAPLHYAHYDGTFMHFLALCDPPTGGPTYCRPLSGCRLPERQPANSALPNAGSPRYLRTKAASGVPAQVTFRGPVDGGAAVLATRCEVAERSTITAVSYTHLTLPTIA